MKPNYTPKKNAALGCASGKKLNSFCSNYQKLLTVTLFFIALFGTDKTAKATNYTFTGSGNWSTANNWASNSIPPTTITSEDSIVINGSGACTLDVNQIIYNDAIITINSGATVNSFSNSTLTVNGTLLNYGTYINTDPSRLSFNSGSTYIHSQNGGTVPTAAWNANSTCKISVANYPGGMGQTFGNVTIISTVPALTMNSNLFCNSNLTIDQNTTLNANNKNLTVGGNWTNDGSFSGGTSIVSFKGTNNIIGGAGTTSFYNLIISSTGLVTVATNANANSLTFNNDGTSLTIDANKSLTIANALVLNNDDDSDRNVTIKGIGTITSGALQIGGTIGSLNSDHVTTLTSCIALFTVNGNVTIKSIVSNQFSPSNYNNASFNINSGNVTVTESTILDAPSSAYPWFPSATATINLKNSPQSGTLKVVGAVPFAVSGAGTKNFYFDGTDATVNYARSGTQTVQAGLYTNLILSGNDQKIISSGTGVSTLLSMQGTATATPSFVYPIYSATAALEYKGDGAQITGSEFPASVPKLIINNDDGVSLNGPRTVEKNVTFIDGKLKLDGQVLTLPAVATITGANSTNYVVTDGIGSRLTKNGIPAGTAFQFPIGTAIFYLPMTLTPQEPSSYAVKVFAGATRNASDNNGVPFSAAAKATMIDAIWIAERSQGLTATNVRLQWVDGLRGVDFASYNNNQIGISKFTSPIWEPATSNGADIIARTVNSDFSFTGFSAFAIGTIAFPLPIELRYFTGSPVKNTAQLNWATENDDVFEFTLEKSTDGKGFNPVTTLNSNLTRKYSYSDPIQAGINYFYRLKMKEADGRFTYSNVVNIKTDYMDNPVVTVYPNPATNWLDLNHSLLTTTAKAEVTDMQGRVVISQNIESNTAHTRVNISNLPQGYFMIRIKGEALDISQPFIHQ